MESITHQERLTRRAYWLIRLRWGAVLWTCVATFFAHRLWGVPQQNVGLYGVAAVLVLENILSLWFLRTVFNQEAGSHAYWIRKIIHFQICSDLMLLTVLLHFSGGMENPFVICFFFHMAIASSLLSVRESYWLAAYAVLLLMGLCVLEYFGFVPHYCLKGVLTHGFHADGPYVLGSLGVMAGTLFGVVYMTSDIASKLRQQEEAYRIANVELEQKDRIKNEYVGCVTHDIKGHLAAIQSCQDVVMRGLVGPLNEPQQDFVGRAHTRTAALTRFVRALLSLTEMRLTNHIEMSAFTLKDAMDRSVEVSNSLAREKSVTLVCHEVSPLLEVKGNQVTIEEALSNLLHNAIKYTQAGGQVDLSAEVQGSEARVAVRDTGIGIPQDEVCRVFDEFFRATNARAMEKMGTGLGLSLVKQIVERHGGTISLDSQEGSGTVCQFTLSLADPVDRDEKPVTTLDPAD
ncbi:MAG: HAMP domain-containing histidine kinase, partial [Phycisphaeraceae bacterium]|nr:HAMP domain-containing histidine kinase [Phycisphaeraceae bacterium]